MTRSASSFDNAIFSITHPLQVWSLLAILHNVLYALRPCTLNKVHYSVLLCDVRCHPKGVGLGEKYIDPSFNAS